MRILIWLLVAILLIAHQDYWNWEDPTLVFGFLPVGLFYHACLSVVAGVFWFVVCTLAWPKNLEEDYETDVKVGEAK